MRIELAHSAVQDLLDIRAWYDEQDAGAVGERLLGEILEKIERLAAHPDLGRVVPEFDQSSLRELIHPPFRIVYRRKPESISVVRVRRSERRMDPLP